MLKNKPEFDESSTKSELEIDSTNVIEEAESEEELNNLEPRVDLNAAEPVELSFNLELTIPMPSSSNIMKKLKFSTMMDMWKFMHNQQ
ncbi:hypothetical protein PVK06_024930 [Gossypium arboreum]|uniref:Uncharacterized protein n=1 Tax=Gossypium arboreum TaxID=29729 RepID=A0ABR0PF87_GOSAR|nr:hypothetical protein PVK06_024930 [Gossypium arboreum]